MKLISLLTGRFKLDGGAMFGIVPKRLWSKLNPPDANNLCTWAMRALLVETGNRKILIDTGIGNKQDDKFRQHFEPQGDGLLFEELESKGISRADITDVLLTHLHFDHCGGALWRNTSTGQVEPAFPNAVYWTNERHFNWAVNPNMREKASFLTENFMPLRENGQLQFITGKQLAPGFRIVFSHGHTDAMMLPVLRTPKRTLVYCADTLPSQWHINLAYGMAYDIRPLRALAEKTALLQAALKQGYALFLEHDPVAEAVTVKLDTSGRIVADQVGKLDEILG